LTCLGQGLAVGITKRICFKANLLGWKHENITLNKQAWALVLGKVGRCEDIPDKSSEGVKSNGLALDGAGRRAWGSIVKHLLKMLNENAQVLDFQRFGSLSKSLSIH
jgi:hypothetical protein